MNATKRILITGDVVVDHHIYQGNRDSPDSRGDRGTALRRVPGGAALLFELLGELSRQVARRRRTGGDEQGNDFALAFGLNRNKLTSLSAGLRSFGVWEPFRADASHRNEVWRLGHSLGYGEDAQIVTSFVDAEALSSPADILVLDDGGLGFRLGTAAGAWPRCLVDEGAELPEWVVLKMAAPIADGDLWQALSADRIARRTIVLVSIDDVRREEVRVTSGISWERTSLDLVRELGRNPALSPLSGCRHCIVSFGTEGAIHIDATNPDDPVAKLIFDPKCMEGDWAEAAGVRGRALGSMSCLTAAVTARLAMDGGDVALDNGIFSGLSTTRALYRLGHGEVDSPKPGIPTRALAEVTLAPPERFASARIPASVSSEGDTSRHWTIMADPPGDRGAPLDPLFGIARRVAILGPRVALAGIPFQRFQKLFTVDRDEIEALRNLRQLIRDYDALDSGEKPLSIAVFGAPGSGKSFSVKQVARAVLGPKVSVLEFNLSQFSNPDALAGALHQVRDRVLEGAVPVVFWDEFDSKEYMWLQYLLAPMQDGAFQEGQIVHPIGKCIFVFAGGTSYDFENFGARPDTDAYRRFKLAKGPDFKSRLHGYLNVLGPNRRQRYHPDTGEWADDLADVCFPVRRALLLRVFLGFFGNELLRIDDGVLSALLELNRYAHGARSMENIVKQMLSRGVPGVVRRSDLPPAELMSMHAAYDEFMAIADRDLEFKAFAADLAPAVHAYYRKLHPSAETDMDFDDLPDNYKADNVAAAMRIPRVLSLGQLYVVPKDRGDGRAADAVRVLEAKLDLLAEAEHDGWMEYKLLHDWRYGVHRKDGARVHDLLVPFKTLPEREKEKDRSSVKSYPEILDLVGYRIATAPPREP